MGSKMKPTLVEYRRNSSDMDLSSSDSDGDNRIELPNQIQGATDSKIDKGGENVTTGEKKIDSAACQEGDAIDERRLGKSDYRRDSDIDQYCTNDKTETKSRKSTERSRSNTPDHRKRDNGGRRKTPSPDRRKGDDRRRHRDGSRSPSRRRSSRDYSRPDGKSRSSPNHYRHRSRSPGRHRHTSPKRDHRKRSRRSSRSPDSYRSKRLERKVARIDKLGLTLIAEPKDGHSTNSTDSSVPLPSYYNPGAVNPSRYAEQIQKRKLLWGSKKETPTTTDLPAEQTTSTAGVKTWEAALFKGDNDGKMTEKFKRLMGIKADVATTAVKPPPADGSTIIQKQEEMFSNMEAQYQVARMATHTHRGVGLGFGTFQVPPR